MPKVVIEQERCKGCQLCVEFCPPRVLAMSSTLNTRGFYTAVLIDEERCTSCAACAIVCPDIAITVYRAERVAVR
ncbi:MAG TPA: 4Fe-4S binding protein [bacterium]|nr:4Fe-4S binding protein [bacterium]